MKDINSESTEHSQNLLDASHDFERARFKSFWNTLFHRWTKLPKTLLSLDEIKRRFDVGQENYLGLQNVPLEKVMGSEGRHTDFDRNFLPTNNKTRERWIGINAAIRSGVSLPPVQLYKIDDAYFVRDGNHRISVMKVLGLDYVEAEVTEIESPVKLNSATESKEILIKQEYSSFLELTGLRDHIHRRDEIELTELGGYDIILEHIRFHQYAMEIDKKRKLTYKEAALSWYRNLFLPFSRLVVWHKLKRYFPNHTTGDIYTIIFSNRKFLLREFILPLNPQAAVKTFLQKYVFARKREIDAMIDRLKQSR
jgi:hypothetical protein